MEEIHFKRIYVDLPADVDKLLAIRAINAGMSKKAYLAQLIETDAQAASKQESKHASRRSKKR